MHRASIKTLQAWSVAIGRVGDGDTGVCRFLVLYDCIKLEASFICVCMLMVCVCGGGGVRMHNVSLLCFYQ